MITVAESESDFRMTPDTPYLARKLWGVRCEDLEKIDRVITAPHCTTCVPFVSDDIHIFVVLCFVLAIL